MEQSKDFTAIVDQIADKKKAIKPQLDRVLEAHRREDAARADKERRETEAREAKERREAAQEAALALVRGPMPHNSGWDGSVFEVEHYLKSVMNDPDSYQHVRSSAVGSEGNYWVVTSVFRGNNAFGAKVLNARKFYIQGGQVVRTADLSSDD